MALKMRNKLDAMTMKDSMHNTDYTEYWYPALRKLMVGTLYNSSQTVSYMCELLGWDGADVNWTYNSFRLSARDKRLLKMIVSDHWPTLYKAMQARGEIRSDL